MNFIRRKHCSPRPSRGDKSSRSSGYMSTCHAFHFAHFALNTTLPTTFDPPLAYAARATFIIGIGTRACGQRSRRIAVHRGGGNIVIFSSAHSSGNIFLSQRRSNLCTRNPERSFSIGNISSFPKICCRQRIRVLNPLTRCDSSCDINSRHRQFYSSPIAISDSGSFGRSQHSSTNLSGTLSRLLGVVEWQCHTSSVKWTFSPTSGRSLLERPSDSRATWTCCYCCLSPLFSLFLVLGVNSKCTSRNPLGNILSTIISIRAFVIIRRFLYRGIFSTFLLATALFTHLATQL